ncbi:hatching enzyme [Fusarium albosuccineum]|uniref:Metalloendopeptidase n=1 Tax=Fusarium albosuccineum TaxID=1237068 RepID=A0A8H4PDX8_9HYPO|nr:hatching enzyme [Fusarium albosuccineum]
MVAFAWAGPGTPWRFRRIPYEFEPGFPDPGPVRKAMNVWERACGVSFVPRRREVDYLVVRHEAFNSKTSSIGMQGGSQSVFVGVGFKPLHELGHTLGLLDEQCRKDRDEHVIIQWQNIWFGDRNPQFNLQDSQNLTAYDPHSIMHNPAPATGWGGFPRNKETWTMRWKADTEMKLGPKSWNELSSLDKRGVRAKYETVPVPMGAITAKGFQDEPYAVSFPFSVGGRHFLYGHNPVTTNWFIRELLPGGIMGCQTQNGTLLSGFSIHWPFTIAGHVYFYAQNPDTNKWFIKEIVEGGKMSRTTQHGWWSNGHEARFPYSIDGYPHFYAQKPDTGHWFIRDLMAGGQIGRRATASGQKEPCEVLFPYVIANDVFFYGQHQKTKSWFTTGFDHRHLNIDKIDDGVWDNSYKVQFPYRIGLNQYFYGQDQKTNLWFIQNLKRDGTMGDELQRGFWDQPYGVQLHFSIAGRHYLYGQKITSGYDWFIRELHDVL